MSTKAYLAKDKFNHAIQALKPSTTQSVAISGTSAATSNALDKNVVVVRVVSTTNCFIRFGTGTPTAVTTDMPIMAFTPEYFRVDAQDTIKVAGIQISAGGTLYVTEMV